MKKCHGTNVHSYIVELIRGNKMLFVNGYHVDPLQLFTHFREEGSSHDETWDNDEHCNIIIKKIVLVKMNLNQ